jgi:hypothetical protein
MALRGARIALLAQCALVLALAVIVAAAPSGDWHGDNGQPNRAHRRKSGEETAGDKALEKDAHDLDHDSSASYNGKGKNSHAHEPVRDTVKDAHSLKERLVLMEKLLKLKEAQVRDAVDTSKYYTDAYKANIEKIKKLNRIVETSRKGGKAIMSDLEKERKVERKLREKLEKDEQMLGKLEDALSSAKRAASDPALSQWIRRRVESLAILIQDEPAAQALGRVVGAAVDDTRNSVMSLELEVEHRVHNKGIAILACVLVALLPFLVVRWALSRVTKALSYRQHVLIGNLFNFILLLSLIAATVLLQSDPMVTVRKFSPHYFVIVQAFFVVQWPIMLFLIIHTVLSSSARQDRVGYTIQLCVMISIMSHVIVVTRNNILFPEDTKSNLLNYILFNRCDSYARVDPDRVEDETGRTPR